MPFDGMQLGNYRLLRLIGRGGMGEVYVAEDIRTPRQLAVKIAQLDPQPFINTEAVGEVTRLFHREMQVIISLDHPNILPLIDFGETTYEQHSTLLYIVMPYRPEGSLANWLTRQHLNAPLTLRDATSFVLQAADALQHAHDHHVVHQDVKLANFLVREHHNRPRHPDLLLTDFGIARITSSNSTQSQQFRGTPSAMPPEQWEGQPVAASDQYALAIMAYQLLTGRSPFVGSMEQVMHQHFAKQPDPPSQHNHQLPPGVDDVILQALAKSPAQRHPSIMAFAQALQYLSADPIHFQATPTFSAEETLPTQKSLLTPVLPPPVISYSQPAMTPQMVSPRREPVSSQETTIGPVTGASLPSRSGQPVHKPRPRTFVLALLALLLIVPAGIITATQVHQARVRSEQATAEAIRQITLAHQQATHAAATAQVTYAAATATAQAAAACYNKGLSAGPSSITPGVYLLPSHAPWLSTTTLCQGSINVRFSQLTAPIQIQVCFIATQNCNAWTDITTANQWYQLVTNLPENTPYRFGIKNTQTATIQLTIAS